MNRRSKWLSKSAQWAVLSVLLFNGAVLVASENAKSKKETSSQTRSDMLKIFSPLVSVLPLSFDKRRFADPANEQRIKQSLMEIEKMTHKVSGKTSVLPIDPISRLVVRSLAEDASDALQLFNDGQKEYARFLVRDLTGYCIACHTSSPKGRRDFPSNALAEQLAGLTSLEKANFYAATRQYDESIKQYEFALLEMGKSDQLKDVWMLAVKRLMAVIVRVRNEPFLALELVSRIREEDAVPPSFLAVATQWRKSIRDWRDVQIAKSGPKGGTLALVRALVERGEELNSKVGADAGLVEFLRASRLVNDALMHGPSKSATGDSTAELLLYGGRISEAISEMNFWTPELFYFEACIKAAPHSVTAGKCFDRFKAIAVSRNAKSGEVMFESLLKKLDGLEKLAKAGT